MRKWLIGIGITVIAAALGVGAGYGGSRLIKPHLTQIRAIQPVQERQIPGERVMPGMGRMNRFFQGPVGSGQTGVVNSTDEAVTAAETIAARVSPDIQPTKVYEFQNAYIVVFTEKGTSRGAIEVVVSRDGGNIGNGLGPMTGWNLKYTQSSPMGHSSGQTDSTLTIDTARSDAQAYLEKSVPGAALDSSGFAFYGYYTFSYVVNGQPAGLVSVNGLNGDIWAYDGFGQLIAEKEVTTS